MDALQTAGGVDWFSEEQIAIRPSDVRRRRAGSLVASAGKPKTPLAKLPPITVPFLCGPTDAAWLWAAMQEGIDAARVGLVLWRLVGATKYTEVRVSSAARDDIGVTRQQVHRGLAALERAGLVAVTRHGNRNPAVKVVTELEGYYAALRARRGLPDEWRAGRLCNASPHLTTRPSKPR